MAVTEVNKGTTATVSGTTHQITLPASGIANGDCLIIGVSYSATTTTITGAGLTGLVELNGGVENARSGQTSAMFVKQNLLTADQSTVITFTTATARKCVINWTILRGISQTAAVDVVVLANAVDSTTVNAPAITTAHAGAVVVHYLAGSNATLDTLTMSGTPNSFAITTQGHTTGAAGESVGALSLNLTQQANGATISISAYTCTQAVANTSWSVSFTPTAATVAPSAVNGATTGVTASAGTILACITDGSSGTFVTALAAAVLDLQASLAEPPAADDFVIQLDDSQISGGGTTGTVIGRLYDGADRTTPLATSATLNLTTTSLTRFVTWTAASVLAITPAQWANLGITLTHAAS